MKDNVLLDISNELEGLVKRAAPFLVHIGGEDIPYRSGIVWDERHILTIAWSAEDGESVPVLFADGKRADAEVQAFDGANGVALLKTAEPLPPPAWEGEAPRLGALAVTVAFPSPAGPEARMEMTRCVGGDYFQTDGAPFPGFAGAAVLSPAGRLWGLVTANEEGNGGLAMPYETLAKLVGELETTGSRRRRVLGVRTQPVEEGLLVTDVAADSAARAAGMLVGDIILKAAGSAVEDPFALLELLERSPGKIEVVLKRGGREMTVTVEPQEEKGTTAREWRHWARRARRHWRRWCR